MHCGIEHQRFGQANNVNNARLCMLMSVRCFACRVGVAPLPGVGNNAGRRRTDARSCILLGALFFGLASGLLLLGRMGDGGWEVLKIQGTLANTTKDSLKVAVRSVTCMSWSVVQLRGELLAQAENAV